LTGLSVLLTGSIFTSAQADVLLTPHIAEYKVKVYVLSGKLHTEVRLTEDGYSVESILRAAGIASMFVRGDVVERATFQIAEDGVRPLRYESADKISSEDKFMMFDFDWSQATVSGTINNEPVALPLEGQVHDRVSIQYELMLDLINGRENSTYSLLDDDELKVLEITNIGRKTVKVPHGSYEAVGIQHRKEGSDRITTLWCAEALDYLPVLIEQHRDGKRALKAVLKEYTPLEIAAELAATQTESTTAASETLPQ